MDTLKTAVVVVLLLAVLYGVYVVLNKPGPPPIPEEFASWDKTSPQLQVDLGSGAPAEGVGPTVEDHSDHMKMAEAGAPDMAAGQPITAAEALAPPTSDPLTPPDLLAGDPQAGAPGAPDVGTPSGALAGNTGVQLPSDPGSSMATGQGGYDAVPPTDSYESPPATYDQPQDGGYASAPPAGYDSPPTPDTYASTPTQPGGATAETFDSTPTAEPAPPSSPYAETPTSAAATPTTNEPLGNFFDSVLESVESKIKTGDWDLALNQLSNYYEDPELTDDQRQTLLDWLDPLAAKVIYSEEHTLEGPYQVQRGENLRSIAERFSVPWQLLANINGIQDPDNLPEGTQLKVMQGPFRAEVSLSRNELTLFAGKAYAGRFPITMGNMPAPAGEYTVSDKQPGRTYYFGGQTIPAGAPDNPYGTVWLDLGGGVMIHGSPDTSNSTAGCVALQATDARDVYGILSKGSKVTIRR